MVLQKWSEPEELFPRPLFALFSEDDAVWVAHTYPVEGEALAVDVDGRFDEFRRLHTAWQRRRFECGGAHLDGRFTRISKAIDVKLDLNDPSLGLDAERLPAGPASRVEVAAENPEPVTRFLGCAAIGIVDAHAEVGSFRRDEGENAIAADPPVPVAYGPDRARRQLEVELNRIERDVVVAKSVALEETISHGQITLWTLITANRFVHLSERGMMDRGFSGERPVSSQAH